MSICTYYVCVFEEQTNYFWWHQPHSPRMPTCLHIGYHVLCTPPKKIQELREMTHNIDRVRFVLRPWCNCSWKFLPYFLRPGSTKKVPPRPSKPMVESFVYMLLSQTMSYISDVMQNPRKKIYIKAYCETTFVSLPPTINEPPLHLFQCCQLLDLALPCPTQGGLG